MLFRITVLTLVLHFIAMPWLKAQDKQVVFYKIKDNGTVSAYTMKLVSNDPGMEIKELQASFLADKAIFDWKFFPHLNQVDLEVYNTLPYATLISRLQGLGYTIRTE